MTGNIHQIAVPAALAACLDAFRSRRTDRLRSLDLLEEVGKRQAGLWPQLTDRRRLAALLRRARVRPRDQRFGQQILKAYRRPDVERALARLMAAMGKTTDEDGGTTPTSYDELVVALNTRALPQPMIDRARGAYWYVFEHLVYQGLQGQRVDRELAKKLAGRTVTDARALTIIASVAPPLTAEVMRKVAAELVRFVVHPERCS